MQWMRTCFRRILIWGVGSAIIMVIVNSMEKIKIGENNSEIIAHLSPKVDTSPIPTETQIIHQIEQYVPSLPISFWKKHKHLFYNNSITCARYPHILDLKFNNDFWQILDTSNGTFYIFGAYYDNRKLSRIGPSVRILAMINKIDPGVMTFCHLWFKNHLEPVVVKTLRYNYIWRKEWGNPEVRDLHPYLLTCPIPPAQTKEIPDSVSIVEERCQISTNNLRVIYNKPEKKKGFAVCVKGLDFPYEDISVRLIEWIELLGVLGAEKIIFYEYHVHPNISKVLRYYKKVGKVDVVPLTLPGDQPNIPGLQHLYLDKPTFHVIRNEVIPYNDCLYKNLYSYEYIVLMDIDEVIMPIKEMSWRGLINTVLSKTKVKSDSYHVRNVYFLGNLKGHDFFKDIPQYMHMLQHVYRSKNFTKPDHYVKSFHDPERVLTLHNHFPIDCLSYECISYAINTNDAQLQHYRADCVTELKDVCDDYRKNRIKDIAIWRFKDVLLDNVSAILNALGYFT